MIRIDSLEQLIEVAAIRTKRRIVVAAAADEPVLCSIHLACTKGIIDPILIGNASDIKRIVSLNQLDSSTWEIIHEADPFIAVKKAVQVIRSGNADILMKGMVSTAPLLKAVLDKETGIKRSDLLSHVAILQTPFYHKLIGVSDAAMNISPSLAEKINITENILEIFHKLGHSRPKVAILAPVETINEKIQSTVDAGNLRELNQNNTITGCVIDGPLALDNAISVEAAKHKNIRSEVAGDADILITPDLNSGNILYKSLVFLSGADSAAIITGARVPIVLTSRADNEKSKLYSIALAAVL